MGEGDTQMVYTCRQHCPHVPENLCHGIGLPRPGCLLHLHLLLPWLNRVFILVRRHNKYFSQYKMQPTRHWRAHRNFARAFRIDYQTVGGATTWTAMLQTAGSWCLAACALLAFFCSQVISSEPKYVRIMHLIPSSCPVSINNTYSIQSLFPTKKKTPNVYFASLLFCVRASITNPPSTIVLPTASNRTRPP